MDQDRLWKAANLLRGQLDAAAYKHVILALVFLRIVSSGKSVLRVPAAARWERLRKGGLTAALEALERANPRLRGALPRHLEDVSRLDELLDLIGGIQPDGESHDSLGRVYEYFLDRFARAEGRRGGQFYTPRCVVRLLGTLLGPLHDRVVYDPCCGAGGMFVQGGDVHTAFGQESNPATWRLARLNLALHGIDGDLGPGPADTLRGDIHAGRRADVVLANPPFNQSAWGGGDDERWVYGQPPANNANFAWLQHVLAHVAPGGAAGVILGNGSLSGIKSGEGALRRAIVEAGWVDAIIALPPQLFFTTPIPACVWILSRAHPDTTLFIDARHLGALASRTLRVLPAADIDRIRNAYRAYEAQPGFCAVANNVEIAMRHHSLAPGRYVAHERAEPAEPAQQRLRRLLSEWEALAARSESLATEIREMHLGLQ